MNRFTSSQRGRLVVAAVALLLAASTGAAIGLPSAPATPALGTGLTRLVAEAGSSAKVRGIATFSAVPTAAQVAALRGLGLTVQPMKHLPLALVVGSVDALESAVTSGVALDVYPDEEIELLDRSSSDAMGANITRAQGFTGKGVTVAVVDSGCDATHPDLAERVVHNVKLYSGEYVNQRDGESIVLPVEESPFNNSDIGSGHGTHVAGIIAADGGSGDPTHLGVAPDADLVCYSIGEVLFTTAVVSAYDHMLDQKDLWGIDVVNNSWGNSFRHFDPNDPVAVATKAVADKGVAVVFAAGNSGYDNTEMSLNPFSQSPWVISAASTTVKHQRSNFSSNGLVFDNSAPVAVPTDGHTRFKGSRIGIYHPDVAGPGEDIMSTCNPVSSMAPCGPGENTEASGTSMASPHVAGAAAVLKQANPDLTPTELRWALQATAKPVAVSEDAGAAKPVAAPFWQVGYGRVDLPAAVALVRRDDFDKEMRRLHAARDAAILNAGPLALKLTDYWTFAAERVAVGGSDATTFRTVVDRGTTHLRVTLSHPSLAVIGENGMSYSVTVTDGRGKEIGTTTDAATGAGTATVLLDLAKAKAAAGEFRFTVAADYGASDPDSIDSASLAGETLTLQVAHLKKR